MTEVAGLTVSAIDLLAKLIEIPSFSREECLTADLIEGYFSAMGIATHRIQNNVFAYNKYFDPSKPTILLNSHHDTVKPSPGYTLDPFKPIVSDGKLYGLGSNDAGGALVSLVATFTFFYHHINLHYNLCLAATAEEEISGPNGMELFVKASSTFHQWGKNVDDFAIIGEPTQMQMAIAEKGLLVLDCLATGKTGHAARDEGINALYIATQDITWLKNYKFDKVSSFLGPVKTTVTCIHTENKAHNVVPALCNFVVDIRVNELYTFEEILKILRQNLKSSIKPRSTRLKSSLIPEDHPIVLSGLKFGKAVYGSPTTSDKALVGIPALKMGPGDSARSHTADEYIYLYEIENGINEYITLLQNILT